MKLFLLAGQLLASHVDVTHTLEISGRDQYRLQISNQPSVMCYRPAVAGVAFIFGALHQGGGRNSSFVVWATAVGLVYGIAYLYTQDLLVPASAHSIANLVSAVLWKSQNPDVKK